MVTDVPATLTHIDGRGDARMVDVGEKPETVREATARATIIMRAATAATIRDNAIPKGDVLAVARIAGIMGAKRTPDLVPLCHPIAITGADVTFAWDSDAPAIGSGEASPGNHEAHGADSVALHVHATVRTVGRTGVEMEALTAVVASMEGSAPAPGAGSVIAKQERSRPSTIGRSQRSFCASVATASSRWMLPSSGA